MFTEIIGDAKESLKRMAISMLRDDGVIRAVKVIPLFTSGELKGSLLETYAAVLGVSVDDVAPCAAFPRSTQARAAYFSQFESGASDSVCVMVDPSTGLRDERKDDRKDENYITSAEIDQLLNVPHERFLIVYDEAYSRCDEDTKRDAVAARVAALRGRGHLAFAYYGGSVVLLFIANDFAKARWGAAKDTFLSKFGGRPDRIIQ